MLVFLLVFIALAFWSSFYLALILSRPKEKYEWHCRIVTCAHAIVVVSLSGWSVFIRGPWPFNNPAMPNTRLEEFTCAISYGYFLFDFLWCVYFRTEGAVMLFHHLLTMFGDTVVLARGHDGGEMMAALFGTEVTNPLLQLRWFLRENSRFSSPLVLAVIDMTFLGLFTLMRIIIGSALLYSYMLHPRPDVISRGGAVSIYLVGWVFWVAIVRYAWRKYVSPKPRRNNGSSAKYEKPQSISHENLGHNFAGGDGINGMPRKENATSLLRSDAGCSRQSAEFENGYRHRTVFETEGGHKKI